MPHFAYKAINESGSTVSGTIEADSADAAMMLLNAQGYIPSKVVEKEAASSSGFWSKIKAKTAKVKIEEIVIFT
ncbi:MAG: type II secretion system F family protein, partial [Syntrophaceae bacterium]|nr:type II secretion system F family protein [Syntrophaceae bacterium]